MRQAELVVPLMNAADPVDNGSGITSSGTSSNEDVGTLFRLPHALYLVVAGSVDT